MPFKAIFIFFNSKSQDFNTRIISFFDERYILQAMKEKRVHVK